MRSPGPAVARNWPSRFCAQRKFRLAVENHKDQRIEEKLALLKKLSSEFIGLCVDVGNNFPLLEDPLELVQAFAPWAFTVHLKDQAVREYDEGFLLADVALGAGFLDLPRIVKTLRDAKPDIKFNLETITRDALEVPVLTERFWVTLRDTPASALAHAAGLENPVAPRTLRDRLPTAARNATGLRTP